MFLSSICGRIENKTKIIIFITEVLNGIYFLCQINQDNEQVKSTVMPFQRMADVFSIDFGSNRKKNLVRKGQIRES